MALEAPALRRAQTIAAYVSIGDEPGTGPLIEALAAAGKRVLLPVLQDDNDLDWAPYDGEFRPGRFGLREPAGSRLGVEAISSADLVLVPGLAASARGDRLGRGGGSYDRALARVAPDRDVWVLLYDGEVGLTFATEPHDRRVSGVITPSGRTLIA